MTATDDEIRAAIKASRYGKHEVSYVAVEQIHKALEPLIAARTRDDILAEWCRRTPGERELFGAWLAGGES